MNTKKIISLMILANLITIIIVFIACTAINATNEKDNRSDVDLSNYYTKSEIDNIIKNIGTTCNIKIFEHHFSTYTSDYTTTIDISNIVGQKKALIELNQVIPVSGCGLSNYDDDTPIFTNDDGTLFLDIHNPSDSTERDISIYLTYYL